MTRFSKIKRGFALVAMIFILVFIAGMAGLLAQTTQDGVVGKDKSPSDTVKREGFFWTGISAADLADYITILIFITTILIIVIIVVVSIRRGKLPSMPEVLETNEEIKNAIIGVGTGIILMLCGKLPSISEVLGTSEKISNVLRDKHSREYWWAEIIVVLVSWNPVSSYADKAAANAYKKQKSGSSDQALQIWLNAANSVKKNDENLPARAWFSAGYLYIETKLSEKRLSTDDIAIRPQLGSPEVYINLDAVEKASYSYSEAIRLKQNYAEAYYNRGIVKSYLDKHEDAIADFDKVIELKDDHVDCTIPRL